MTVRTWLAAQSSDLQYSTRNAVQLVKDIVRSEGAIALFKGNTATVFRCVAGRSRGRCPADHYDDALTCTHAILPVLPLPPLAHLPQYLAVLWGAAHVL